MAQQIALENRIKNLESEIAALEEKLEATCKEKADYCSEILNDPTAKMRRIDMLSKGYDNASEFTSEQLEQVKYFNNSINEIEYKIRSNREQIQRLKESIAKQQRREAAEKAVEPRLEKFNQTLLELKQRWEELKVITSEHEIELPAQFLPEAEEALLYEAEPQWHTNFESQLKIKFKE